MSYSPRLSHAACLWALPTSCIIVIGVTIVVGLCVRDPKSFAVHSAMGLVATILTCLIYRVLLNAPAVGAMLLANLGAFSASDQEIRRSHRLSERVLAWVNGEVESSIATARPQSRFAFKD